MITVMDAYSEAEEDHNHHDATTGNKNNKQKRQMKTPFQLETLEMAYSRETYPSETTRTKLSRKLGLTDRQLQMWFCHRRLKDRRENKKDNGTMTMTTTKTKKSHGKAPNLTKAYVDDQLKVGGESDHHIGSDYESECGSGSSRFVETRNVGCFDNDVMLRKCYQSSPLSDMKLRAIAYVEAQLEEPLKGDGPVIGIEFDPLPPDAFGTVIAMTEQEQHSSKAFQRHEGKLRNASARSSNHGIHDKVVARSNGYTQVVQSTCQNHPSVNTVMRQASKYTNGDRNFLAVHVVKAPKSGAPLLPPQPRIEDFLPSSPDNDDDDGDDDDEQFLQPPAEHFENTKRNDESTSSRVRVFHEDHDSESRPGKRRKSNESRLLEKDKAHENRIRKGLDTQENPRTKDYEQQQRKEAYRDRRDEKDRFAREREQHEDERMFEIEYPRACNLSQC